MRTDLTPWLALLTLGVGCAPTPPVDDGALSGDDTAATDTGAPDDTGGGDTAADSGAPDSGDTGLADPDRLTLTQGAGMRASATLTVPEAAVLAHIETSFDWSALRRDIGGSDVAPDSATTVTLTQYPGLTPEELGERLLGGAFYQEEVGYSYGAELDHAASVPLMKLRPLNSAQPPDKAFTGGSGPWVLTVGTEGGFLPHALLVVTPTDDADDPMIVTLGAQSGVLEAAATFEAAVPAATPLLPSGIDWAELSATALGTPFLGWAPDTLIVSRYEGISHAEIAERLTRSEVPPPASWVTRIDQWSSLEDLSTLVGVSGPFPGFDDQGTWVAVLSCWGCAVPFPMYAGLVTEAPAPD